MAKTDAEANDIVLAALMKPWDFRVRSVKLYRLDKPGVDSNRTMNKATGSQLVSTRGTDILQALSIHHPNHSGGAGLAWNSKAEKQANPSPSSSRVRTGLLSRLGRALLIVRAAEQRH